MSRTIQYLIICTVSLACSDALAVKHYTARLGNPNAYSVKVKKIVFSPDGAQLLVATSQGTYIVQSQGAEIVGKIKTTPISMNYSKDGSRAFLIGTYGRKLLDMQQGIEIKYSSASVAGYVGVTLTRKNGKLLVSAIAPGSPCAENGKIHVGDELVSVGEGPSGSMRSVVGSSEKRAVEQIKGPAGTYVRLEVIADGEIHEKTHVLRRLATRLVDGANVYLPIEKTEICENVVWCLSNDNHQFSSAKTGKPISSFRPQNLPWRTGSLAISRDSKQFAWIGKYITHPKRARVKSNMAEVLSKEKKATKDKPASNGGDYSKAVVRSAADSVSSGTTIESSFGVEIFDIASHELLTTFSIANEPVNTIVPVPVFYGAQFFNDGKQLIVGTRSKLHIYDIASGKRVKVISAQLCGSRVVNDFAVSDKLVAIGGVKGNLRLVELNSGKVVEEVENREKNDDVAGLEFSQDGKWLAYVAGKVLHVLNVSGLGDSCFREEE